MHVNVWDGEFEKSARYLRYGLCTEDGLDKLRSGGFFLLDSYDEQCLYLPHDKQLEELQKKCRKIVDNKDLCDAQTCCYMKGHKCMANSLCLPTPKPQPEQCNDCVC